MSTEVNINILERAAEMIDYFEGKLPAKLIEGAIDQNDLDLVRKFTLEAEALASQNEFHSREAI